MLITAEWDFENYTKERYEECFNKPWIQDDIFIVHDVGIVETYLQSFFKLDYSRKNTITVDGTEGYYDRFPDLPEDTDEIKELRRKCSCMLSCGTADSLEMIKERIVPHLQSPNHNYCIFVRHFDRDSTGWRWHKQGPYIGDQDTDYEYFEDTPGFEDGVWSFSIEYV